MTGSLADLAIDWIKAEAYVINAFADGLNNYDDYVSDVHETRDAVAALNADSVRQLVLLVSDVAIQLLLAHREGVPGHIATGMLDDHATRGWQTTVTTERLGIIGVVRPHDHGRDPWGTALPEPPF